MSLSIFDEKALIPNDEQVERALGSCYSFWCDLRDYVSESTGQVVEEWKFYSKKAGWSLLIKEKKRTLFYLIPCEKIFKVNFVLGANALAAAKESLLQESVLEDMNSAPKYAEGTSFMFDVSDEDLLANAKTLIDFKREF